MNHVPVGIVGLGAYVPERVLSNHDLVNMVDTSDEWIRTRTGIRERRICVPAQDTSDLAGEAAKRALADAGLEADQIDLIICCTMTPDYICPSTACLVQGKLGLTRPIPAFDLSAACSGFVYGCSAGASFIQADMFQRVLVIGAESISRVMDYKDRNTCVLFGDGAGAVVLAKTEPGHGLLGQCLRADGSGANSGFIMVPTGGSSDPFSRESPQPRDTFLSMSGNDVYKFATRILGTAIEEALKNMGNGAKPADLDLIIPHQANIRIIEVAARKLDLPLDRFVINIERYGNTSAAAVPLAMVDARADGRLQKDSLIAIVAFGGGLTYAASIWRW